MPRPGLSPEESAKNPGSQSQRRFVLIENTMCPQRQNSPSGLNQSNCSQVRPVVYGIESRSEPRKTCHIASLKERGGVCSARHVVKCTLLCTGMFKTLPAFKIMRRDEHGAWAGVRWGWSACGLLCAWGDGRDEGGEEVSRCEARTRRLIGGERAFDVIHTGGEFPSLQNR